MLIDLDTCVGCDTCTVACKLDNRTEPLIKWGRVVAEESGMFPHVRRVFIPMLCMHCDEPQCVEVCPTGASFQRTDGIVLVDQTRCVGCKFCMVACPYQARYVNSNGVVDKCDFCIDRVDEGHQPLCVETCPYDARIFGDLDDENSEISKAMTHTRAKALKSEEVFHPRVYYATSK
jgi:Fe-S-cluster-containing dehydrogenase component